MPNLKKWIPLYGINLVEHEQLEKLHGIKFNTWYNLFWYFLLGTYIYEGIKWLIFK